MKNTTCHFIAISFLLGAAPAMAAIDIDPKAYHAQREAEKKARAEAEKNAPVVATITAEEQKTIEKKALERKKAKHSAMADRKSTLIAPQVSATPETMPIAAETASTVAPAENQVESVSTVDANAAVTEVKQPY